MVKGNISGSPLKAHFVLLNTTLQVISAGPFLKVESPFSFILHQLARSTESKLNHTLRLPTKVKLGKIKTPLQYFTLDIHQCVESFPEDPAVLQV